MSSIIILGFGPQDKIPRFAGETKYGAGPISAGSIPITLLLVGLKADGAGTMTEDTDVLDVFSSDEADTYAGAGGELATMARAALQVPGIRVKIAAPSPANGAAAAEATITIAGTWTTGGQWAYRIAGEPVSDGIAASDTPTTVATAIAAKVNSKAYLGASATSAAGVVTLTWKTSGVRGNKALLFQDASQLPSGCTSTLAGGTEVTGGGVPFASGSGTEDVSTLLTTLYPGRYHRMAAAQTDATNAGRWKSQLIAKAGPLEGRMEHAVGAMNGTLVAAQSIAKTTLNEHRYQIVWQLNGESHPSVVAAAMAAIRVQHEQATPNSKYDDVILPGVAPQSQRADWANNATLQAALESGLTPLITDEGDLTTARVCRAITTHCLNGTDPDFRTFDVADAVVPDYCRDAARLLYLTDFLPNNPYVRDNPSAEERDPPAGVATPLRWNQEVIALGRELVAQNILERVGTATDDTPYSEYDRTAKRIMTAWPVVRLPHQHQLGVSVRQQNAA